MYIFKLKLSEKARGYCMYVFLVFNSKPTNQVIRYEYEGQVSAKIMLEQKADFLKFVSK